MLEEGKDDDSLYNLVILASLQTLYISDHFQLSNLTSKNLSIYSDTHLFAHNYQIENLILHVNDQMAGQLDNGKVMFMVPMVKCIHFQSMSLHLL